MRHWILRISVIAVLVTGTTLAFAFSTGPPASHTGAPSVGGVIGENVCRACHATFALNLAGATLEILDAPQFYVPSQIYTLRVRMTSTFALPRRWGFQLTAVRESNGQGAGTFDVVGLSGVQIVNGAGTFASRRYVEHTSAGSFDNNEGPVEWSLHWKAPDTDQGRVFFFAAGNAANSSDTNAGDHIYTTRDTTDIHPLLDAPQTPVAGVDLLQEAAPNPFHSSTTFSYSLAKGGSVGLRVFDAQGRVVRTLISGEQPAGPGSVVWDGTRDDGARAAAGLYFANLTTPGARSPVSRRVVLSR